MIISSWNPSKTGKIMQEINDKETSEFRKKKVKEMLGETDNENP